MDHSLTIHLDIMLPINFLFIYYPLDLHNVNHAIKLDIKASKIDQKPKKNPNPY